MIVIRDEKKLYQEEDASNNFSGSIDAPGSYAPGTYRIYEKQKFPFKERKVAV